MNTASNDHISHPPSSDPPLSFGQIFRTWWPLALGWLVLTIEIPFLNAIVARLPNPEENLASWGLVFPIALILASPMMVMLPTSTTLCKDWRSYQTLRKTMYTLSALMLSLHVLIAFTPAYYWLVEGIIAAPPQIVEPSRTALQLMMPWVLSLAYRRFNYGVLIRFGYSSAVTFGALTRLAVDLVVLSTLYGIAVFAPDRIPFTGVGVATFTITMGVIGEALYSRYRVVPVREKHLRHAPPADEPITLRFFAAFYIPLVITILLRIITQPMGTAALSRMPDPIYSLAIWPVATSVLSILSSAGIAYVETVIVLIEKPHSLPILRRFTNGLALLMSGILVVMASTPLAGIWFEQIMGLASNMVSVASNSLWFALLIPGFIVLGSFYEATLLNSRQTSTITTGVVLALASTAILLVGGIAWGQFAGLYVAMAAMAVGNVVRTAWLWYRAQSALTRLGEKQRGTTQGELHSASA
ncbi:MAG: hypothetical protein AAF639_19600 [Chloroflexota bacterium]